MIAKHKPYLDLELWLLVLDWQHLPWQPQGHAGDKNKPPISREDQPRGTPQYTTHT